MLLIKTQALGCLKLPCNPQGKDSLPDSCNSEFKISCCCLCPGRNSITFSISSATRLKYLLLLSLAFNMVLCCDFCYHEHISGNSSLLTSFTNGFQPSEEFTLGWKFLSPAPFCSSDFGLSPLLCSHSYMSKREFLVVISLGVKTLCLVTGKWTTCDLLGCLVQSPLIWKLNGWGHGLYRVTYNSFGIPPLLLGNVKETPH